MADTLSLTLPQAEAQFVDRNLNLIATKFSISESKAYEIQARLRNNPSVYFEQMPYNHITREVLPLKQSNSQQTLQLQQLLLLAGKRQKQYALAQIRTDIAADRFYDLVHTLKYQLRSTFYDLHYAQQSQAVYEEEIRSLQRTVDVYQQQYEKGNVPLKDLSRLKAYLFNLTIEQQQLQRRIVEDQAALAVLLNTSPSTAFRPVISLTDIESLNPASLQTDSLFALAARSRYDLKAFADETRQEEQNWALQRALAIPDLTLQATYDRNGSYIPNYIGVGVGVNLPVFNKNQGNIQAAKIRIQGSQQAYKAYRLQVEAEVQQAFTKVQQTDLLFRRFDKRFNEGFGRLIEGVVLNYQKRNIDVVEFIDFFESYKNVQVQYNQLQNDRLQSLEELNLATGSILLGQ
jgi:cobalt-zinc-cadmium efflux system outer membrane protein